MKKILLVLFVSTLTASCQTQRVHVKQGDIIFQTSLSSQSKAIQLATKSQWSHMGMIFIIDGEPFVYEAVQPVKFTPLNKWIDRGEGKRYVVKRLKSSESSVTPKVIAKMKVLADKYNGKHYDMLFEWSDDQMYCSELVWKIYHRVLGVTIGNLQQLKDFDLSSPVVQKKMKERYGEKLPYNESVISPEQMFQSHLLETVPQP